MYASIISYHDSFKDSMYVLIPDRLQEIQIDNIGNRLAMK